MSLGETIELQHQLLLKRIEEILKLMSSPVCPLLVDVPEDASHLSRDEIAQIIAKANNAVNKAAELCGASFGAYKMRENMYDLEYKKALDNDGRNEDQRKAKAANTAEEACMRLQIAETCYRYMQHIFLAVQINSQSARKLVDNFEEQQHADIRDQRFGRPPDKEAPL